MGVPPVEVVYQLYCPFVPPAAVSTTDPPVQIEPPKVVGAEMPDEVIVATTGMRTPSHTPSFKAT